MAENVVFVGATTVTAMLFGPTGKTAKVELLVDSGADYTALPRSVWKDLELSPSRIQRFGLADRTTITRRMSECVIRLPRQGKLTTQVILGERGDVALLGVVTLEEFGLVLNPLDRTVRKSRRLMMRLSKVS